VGWKTHLGPPLPLSVVLAMVGCLLVAVSIGQLARRLPSAGGFATYAARGLHPAVGFLVGWGYAFVEPLVAPLLFLIFGNVVAGTLQQEFGWSYDTWWLVSAVAAAVIVFLLGWFGVRLSTGAGTLLGLFEILVFAGLAVTLIVQAGDANTLAVFGTGNADVEGFVGLSGVIAGSVYTILAFIGFEAAAPLAEEARDPRRTIRLAVIYSCLGIGLFYVLTTYAATVAFGPDRFAEFPLSGDGNPWDALARGAWGVGWVLVFLAVANSAIANANASANAATRTWFALGRIRVLPRPLAHVNPHWRSPDVAVIVQFVVGVVVAVWLGLQYDPLTAFAIVGTIVTAVIIAIYMVVNLACLVFYLREGRDGFNPLLHVVVPLLGIVAFLPAFLTAVGIRAFDFVNALPYPISLVGPVVGIWYAIGLVYLVVLLRTRPERLRETGRVFMEEPEGEAALPS
jgi:amino acid transporter